MFPGRVQRIRVRVPGEKEQGLVTERLSSGSMGHRFELGLSCQPGTSSGSSGMQGPGVGPLGPQEGPDGRSGVVRAKRSNEKGEEA